MERLQLGYEPIRNSTLNSYRRLVEKTPLPERFLKPHFVFGNLVDAFLTRPEALVPSRRKFISNTNYEQVTYSFTEGQWTQAENMAKAFKANPYLKRILIYAKKHEFNNPNFEYEFGGKRYIAHTAGEADLTTNLLNLGLDIKTTAAKTKYEFAKSVEKLLYHQQGSFYSDNLTLEHFIIAGISKKAYDSNGLPLIFLVPLSKDSILRQKGRESYSYWLHKYCQDHNILMEAPRQAA